MTSVVLNGVTYTDDANGSTGMANGGHRVRFVPALANFVIEAATQLGLQHDSRDAADASEAAALASEIAAAASALSAVNAPGTTATSTTSDTIALGSTTLTIQTGKAFVVGQFVTIAYTTDATQWMHGVITAHNTGTGSITVNVTASAGGGTYALWSVALSGPNKSALFYSARTSNTALAITDNNTLIDITSGTFSQTIAAAATLGNGWSCYVRNSGSGVITLDPNGSETIDGAATYTLNPNSTLIVQCDGTTLRTAIAIIKQTRLPIFSATAAAATPVTNLEDIANGVSYSTGLASVVNVCYGDGLFVADGGNSASVATSPDGVTWTLRTMPSTKNWRVEYDGTNFLAADANATNSIATSPDGVTWISGTNLPGTPANGQSIIVGLGGTWLVQASTAGTFYRSTNLGVSWSTETGASGNNGFLTKVNNYFFHLDTGTNIVYYSLTGLTGSWTSTTLPITPGERWRSADGEIYFAVSSAGAQVYQIVNQTTFTAVSGVTLSATGYNAYKVNGVWAVFDPTFGRSWTVHATGKVPRTSSVSCACRKSANASGVSVLGSTGNALTFNSTNSPTAVFEG